MRFELPTQVRATLAARSVRLHHYLWHVIRNNWHRFNEAQRARVRAVDPAWVPNIPRMRPGGELDYDAGESFLYMHRQMILAVNAQLIALQKPALVPWTEPPTPDDPDYPVPGRESGSQVKSDAFGFELRQRCADVLDPEVLRSRSLAWIGAYVESFIHDYMHMRWAAVSPGRMAEFPRLDPTNVNPTIDAAFDDPSVDWLGHPWSSHVDSVFWKLHAWVDNVIEAWRIARGLEKVKWTDTWVGATAPHATPLAFESASASQRLLLLLEHFDHPHHQHGMDELLSIVNAVPGCTAGFSYALDMGLEPPALK